MTGCPAARSARRSKPSVSRELATNVLSRRYIRFMAGLLPERYAWMISLQERQNASLKNFRAEFLVSPFTSRCADSLAKGGIAHHLDDAFTQGLHITVIDVKP